MRFIRLLQVGTLFGVLLLWWVVTTFAKIDPVILPGPGAVLRQLVDSNICRPAGKGSARMQCGVQGYFLWQHLLATVQRIAVGLGAGVILGVLTAFVVFARRVAHFTTVDRVATLDTTEDGEVDTATYRVRGELFFASSNDLVYQFDYSGDPQRIVIDLSESHIWDASTVAALDGIQTKYAARGKRVQIVGLNEASAARHGQLSGHLGEGH